MRSDGGGLNEGGVVFDDMLSVVDVEGAGRDGVVTLFGETDSKGGGAFIGEEIGGKVFIERERFITREVAFVDGVEGEGEGDLYVVTCLKVDVVKQRCGIVKDTKIDLRAGDGATMFPFKENVADRVDERGGGLILAAARLKAKEDDQSDERENRKHC